MKFGTIFKYTSTNSAHKNSKNDLALGKAYHQAGSNRGFKGANCLVAVVNDFDEGYIGLLTKPIDESIWADVDPIAPRWKFNFEVIPITETMPIPVECKSGQEHGGKSGPHPQWMPKKDREYMIRRMLEISKHRNESVLTKAFF
jgi:hypothetical protein